ncbi:MAG: efflux RND transporter periplasmic adaptor subunit [Alphaproteobacteria bacterium]|nr:efflux RND transporter periplasmic adaptor subunit [Alphaproteobacteria bacterium]
MIAKLKTILKNIWQHKWVRWGLILLVVCGLIFPFFGKKNGIDGRNFEQTVLEKGTIVERVTATGKIQPINTVSVGTQISGIVEQVLVDYNDEVSHGQLLAQLDTALLTENKNDAEARLTLANAKKKVAQLNYDRYKKLYQDKLIAKATFEEAEIELASAEAEVLSATAEVNKANRNYGYAQITSPVSGTVISKEVEQGQTVAASYQTPTLFLIAEDLSKMQIEANVAEADIGSIKANMSATFTVDAYPNDTFQGEVKQVRLSPTEDSNVVMYTVVIDVDNSSRKLLPGMTAFVNIDVQTAKDVVRLPTGALQFKPNAQLKQLVEKRKVELKPNEGMVYQFKNGKLIPVVFERGISNASYMEVVSGLNDGDTVVTEYIRPMARR